MRLGLIIQNYRNKNSLSMESFAKRCGLSKAYIGMLEQGIHPKTKKPIRPSVDTIKKVSTGMGMDFETLFKTLDEDISLNNDLALSEPSSDVDLFIEDMKEIIERATPEQRNLILAISKDVVKHQ